jgi:polyisoprenoid-binding protein YceI|tara:strand:- start:172 stop:408 length:237 start_codon:yes stop_codon:yes gene_type:complete
MFHPTFDPKGMSDQDLESKINDVTIKINQAKRMNHLELYNQLLAVNNNLQMEKEQRKIKKSNDKEQTDSNLDGLINVE